MTWGEAAKYAVMAVFAAVILWFLFAYAHRLHEPQPVPSPTIGPAPTSDRVVTVTPAGKPAASSAPTVARLAVTPGAGRIEVQGNQQPVVVRQQPPAVRVVSESPTGKRTVVSETIPGPMEEATVPAAGSDGSAGAVVVTSTPDPVEIVIKAPEHSRIGVIAGLLPGWVAVDVQVLRGHPLQALGIDAEASIDLQANWAQAGAGVAIGDKVFATAGGSIDWSGKPGWYAGLGMRF